MKLLEQLLSEWVTPVLKERGFRKVGLSYEKDEAEAIVVVGYQRSRDRGDCDRFTVNLAVASKRVFSFEDHRTSKRTPVELCRWRIGRTLEGSADTWWELCSAADVSAVGQEQEAPLKTKALPILRKTASDEALREQWKKGKAPRLTELERLMNLSVLLSGPEHRDEQQAVIAELKDLAGRKGFGGRVAVHLEDLGVE